MTTIDLERLWSNRYWHAWEWAENTQNVAPQMNSRFAKWYADQETGRTATALNVAWREWTGK